jgi:choline dehydrogenase-like flavoprotein
VGSGISGGWAAKEFCEKRIEGVNARKRSQPGAWRLSHRYQKYYGSSRTGCPLTPEEKKKNFVQSRHYTYRDDCKHYYINDEENPYTEIKRFDWIRGDIVGGRSLLWARACYRWSDLVSRRMITMVTVLTGQYDIKTSRHGTDYVESYIGVSGNRDGVAVIPDGVFQPPFEMNAAEKYFKQQVERKYTDRKVIIGRTANLTQAINKRGKCQARDLCHRGCPYGAYFSSNSASLPAAIATGNLSLRPHSLVNKVIYDEQGRRAKGVEIIDTETKQTEEFYARIIFLNAATVATAAILLNSVSSRFPNGLGNGSDQVGRNLMDHHKGLSFSANVEGLEEMYYSGRRPNPVYIPRFRNVNHKMPGFIRGYHFGGSGHRPRQAGDAVIGKELKEALSEPGSWRMSLYAFGECLPYADNRVTLDRNKKDPFGRPMIAIECEFKDNEKAMHEDIKITGQEMLEAAGFKDAKVSGSISFPGNANHEMGIARMGSDPKTSVLNKYNQMHEVPNVFITDGSCMTSSSCLNPSLTYMALTARACDYATREMSKKII